MVHVCILCAMVECLCERGLRDVVPPQTQLPRQQKDTILCGDIFLQMIRGCVRVAWLTIHSPFIWYLPPREDAPFYSGGLAKILRSWVQKAPNHGFTVAPFNRVASARSFRCISSQLVL